jgi:hypothetical protein
MNLSHDNALLRWRKSSYSTGGQEGNCVEVALPNAEELAAVRDSKNPGGPVLAFSPVSFAAFRRSAEDGRFDLS